MDFMNLNQSAHVALVEIEQRQSRRCSYLHDRRAVG